jgi:hypothetical protein
MNNTVRAWLINNVPLTGSNNRPGGFELTIEDKTIFLPYVADCNSVNGRLWLEVHPGRLHYSISDNKNTIHKDHTVEINDDNDNILVIQGRGDYPDSIELVNYSVNSICPINGEANVTFIHSAALIPSVNVEISGYSNKNYGGTGGSASVEKSFTERYHQPAQHKTLYPRSNNITAGRKIIRITNSNNGQEILKPLSVNLDTGNYYFIMSGAPMSQSNYQGDSEGPCIILIKADCKSQIRTASRRSNWKKLSSNIYIGH